jgi:23S rRNA pseudouridine1911/1915/1917 synthase
MALILLGMKCIIDKDQSLLEALSILAPDSSKTTHRSWLKDGRVTVDGEVVKLASTLVRKGQEVSLNQRLRFIEGLQVYYEDRHLIIIEKPAGLLSVSSATELKQTAHNLLKNYFRPKKVFPVHRLDQDTSGIMMFALSELACEHLKADFEQHLVQREYTGVVEGTITPSQGTWKSYLVEDANFYVHQTNNPELGRLAVTHYQVQQVARNRSLVTFKLETGRKNQIRVHCQAAEHPIVGDKKYGAQSNSLKRLCLHAHMLAFRHPITNQAMQFESPVPTQFFQLLQ